MSWFVYVYHQVTCIYTRIASCYVQNFLLGTSETVEAEEEDPYGGSTDEGSDMDTQDYPGIQMVCLLATRGTSINIE